MFWARSTGTFELDSLLNNNNNDNTNNNNESHKDIPIIRVPSEYNVFMSFIQWVYSNNTKTEKVDELQKLFTEYHIHTNIYHSGTDEKRTELANHMKMLFNQQKYSDIQLRG